MSALANSLPSVAALLLDIEGTTTPIDFVHRTLFSYVRTHLRDYLQAHWNEAGVGENVRALQDAQELDAQNGLTPPDWNSVSGASQQASVLAYVNWLMDKDAKRTALKSLQGKIWQQGYQDGSLTADVYPDVPVAFLRWSQQSRSINIFSSGSVLAQKLLFAHTRSGDLSSFLRRYFDTTTGAKGDSESYRNIATALALPPSNILFISDSVPEVDAARAAEMQTLLCVRGPLPPGLTSTHEIIHTFDTVLP